MRERRLPDALGVAIRRHHALLGDSRSRVGLAKNKFSYGISETFGLVAVGHRTCPRLYLVARIAHSDAKTSTLEHRDIIAAVTDDCNFRQRHAQQLR